jgi:hypothetical protein
MKWLCLGILTGTIFATSGAIAQQPENLFPQRTVSAVAPATTASGADLIVLSAMLGEKGQMLTVVDPRQQVICVYHIDLNSGKIALKSARKITWDLQITDFNNEIPMPREIQSRSELR